MNIVEITEMLYPGEMEAGNIKFYQPENEILIQIWTVPGVPQPTEAEILAQEPTVQWPFDYGVLVAGINVATGNFLDITAQEKGYNNAICCVSYVGDANLTWSDEGTVFRNYRGAVWSYIFSTINGFSTPGSPLPTLESVMSGAPTIVWP